MKAKYICFGGWVDCLDGDKHYIPPFNLPRLYNVNPRECIFIGKGDEHKLRGVGFI